MKPSIYISTDKAKLDLPFIYEYLSEKSYWAKGRSRERILLSINNSLCFGAYSDIGRQLGFARVVTDGVVMAWLMDVFIASDERGKGIGGMLLSHILNHELVREVNGVGLKTKDAHGFYGQHGFSEVPDPEIWMYRKNSSRKEYPVNNETSSI
jgi:GNAT superfamily N-acetyltransferase